MHPFARWTKGPFSRWLTWALIAYLAVAIGDVGIAQAPPAYASAGLIVDYGDGRISYAIVPFEEQSISGIDMLRRSGLDLVTVPFGGLGVGVCAIGSTGCDPGACRTRLCQSADRESPFWQFVRQGDDGTWAPAALGASQARVEDGDVDAWVWTGTPPELPTVTMASLRDRLSAPAAWPAGDADPQPLVLTEGGVPEPDGREAWRELVPGLAVIAAVAMTGALLLRRTRRTPPPASEGG